MSVATETIFGPIVSGDDVERWCVELAQAWVGTYLAEVERQHGLVAGALQRPRAYVRTASIDKWPEDQLPALFVISVGTAETPLKQGTGAYRARFDVAVGCVCSARTQDETHALAMLYGAALRALFVQRPSLDGHAAGTVWTGERYDDLDYDDTRSLAFAAEGFTIEVDDVVYANAGPLIVDDPLVPDTDPWPLDPIADEVDVVVESMPHVEPHPEGGQT